MPFYDNFSMHHPTPFGDRIASRESSRMLQIILKYGLGSTSILEVGPGRGFFAGHCLQKNLDYTCADISWPLLTGLENVEKSVRALVPPFPFADSSFDIVFSANLLEHMLNFRTAFRFIDEMQRVVRPRGLVCQRVPNAMSWGLHFWNGDYTHSFFTTPRTVSQVYLDAGLKIERIYPVSGPMIGNMARILSLFGKLVPTFLVNHGAGSSVKLAKMLYSAKTTFLLGLLIVGRKV